MEAWLIECWKERQSFARSATRLERAASQRNRGDLIDRLRALTDTDDAAIERRMCIAPDPIRRWHGQSLRARRAIGEPVTEIQNARDTLVVARHYELRKRLEPPYPEWLAVVNDRGSLERKMVELSELVDGVILKTPGCETG